MSDSVSDFIYGCELPWEHRNLIPKSDLVEYGVIGFTFTYTCHDDIIWFGIEYGSNSNGFGHIPLEPEDEVKDAVNAAYEELPDSVKQALNGRPRVLVHSYSA